MPVAISPVTLLPLLGLAVPIVFVTQSVLRNRGGSGGRHSGGPQNDSQEAAAPNPRFAAQPDPRFAYAPDPRFGGTDSAFADPPFVNTAFGSAGFPSVANGSTSVQSSGGSSSSGDPFPTTGRALALVGGQVLAGLGWLILGLSSKAAGHHTAHVGNSAVGFLGILCVLVGGSFFTVATSRVQRDVMGGGWNSRFSLQYISPQIAWYVLSPAGISAAAQRLKIAPALAMLAVYGILACDVVLMAAHYLGH